MITTILKELHSLNEIALDLFDNCKSLQTQKYSKKILKESDANRKTFFLKFMSSQDTMSHGDQNQLEMTIIKLRK